MFVKSSIFLLRLNPKMIEKQKKNSILIDIRGNYIYNKIEFVDRVFQDKLISW